VDGAAFDQILDLGLILNGMSSLCVGLQVGSRFPFFDDDKRIVAIGRQRAEAWRVDECRIFDAARSA
jgi:hypothetical protein